MIDKSAVIGNEFKNSVWHTFGQVLQDIGVQMVPRCLGRSAQFLYVVGLLSVGTYMTYNDS